jgi:UDP-N-acetylglucosamine--N-acetylmuramyl-(pentapeptide) pyrophosphoryl-undecaprenol N-acetylglucosamine transferase
MAEAKNIAVVFAAGGTGGHLFPAIAVADEMKKLRPDIRIVFAGSREKIEARMVPQKGYEFAPIWISGVHRRLTLTNLLFPVKVIVSLWQSMLLLLSVKPQVVIGTGGYVCGPVLFMAAIMRIPTIVHESNSYPGMTTRMLASRVTDLLITFDVTRKYLKKKNGSRAVLTGNPTRDELVRPRKEEGLRQFGLAADKKTVFVFGGSLGAESINKVIARDVDAFRAAGIQLLWQVGGNAPETYEKMAGNGVVVKRFIDDMASAYAAADLVISRSGATTIAELTRLGKPALLVPYPFAAADHQTMNALVLQDAGGAAVIADREFPEKGMASILSLLQNVEVLKLMSRKSLSLGRPTAGKEIAQRALELAHGN